jgi:hypothetical protein
MALVGIVVIATWWAVSELSQSIWALRLTLVPATVLTIYGLVRIWLRFEPYFDMDGEWRDDMTEN